MSDGTPPNKPTNASSKLHRNQLTTYATNAHSPSPSADRTIITSSARHGTRMCLCMCVRVWVFQPAAQESKRSQRAHSKIIIAHFVEGNAQCSCIHAFVIIILECLLWLVATIKTRVNRRIMNAGISTTKLSAQGRRTYPQKAMHSGMRKITRSIALAPATYMCWVCVCAFICVCLRSPIAIMIIS